MSFPALAISAVDVCHVPPSFHGQWQFRKFAKILMMRNVNLPRLVDTCFGNPKGRGGARLRVHVSSPTVTGVSRVPKVCKFATSMESGRVSPTYSCAGPSHRPTTYVNSKGSRRNPTEADWRQIRTPSQAWAPVAMERAKGGKSFRPTNAYKRII